ncbi:MAG TPA: hypothetical protein VHM65_11250, partial [Candidatus Lustribacter sp.]|nr:hypothetical protein [Candidatus Lustribacter sp.]
MITATRPSTSSASASIAAETAPAGDSVKVVSAGRGPDGLVLVALDRRDDVAHPGAAAAGQGG